MISVYLLLDSAKGEGILWRFFAILVTSLCHSGLR